MTVGPGTKRERPRAFAEDWKTVGTARPPTTIANPLRGADMSATPLTEQEVASARGVDRSGGIDLAPDGREVAFAWDVSGPLEVYAAPLAGDRIIQLTGADARSVAPRWSPDGHWVAFVRGVGGRKALWAVDRDGEHEHEIGAGDPLDGRVTLAAEGVPSWSPDPAPSILDAAGVTYVSGSATSSLDGSTIAFATSVDGRTKIAFAGLRDGAVKRVEVLGQGMPFDDTDPVWRPDGRGVLYRRRDQGNVTVRRIFTTSHVDEAVMDVPGWIFSPRVGPDSETVVAVLVDRQGSDIVVRPKGAIDILRLTHQVASGD